MERVPKTETMNKSKPVDITSIQTSDDCFGNLWKSTDKSCVKCSMYDICMVITKSKNDAKAKDIRDQTGGFLDELDWTLVPWSDIVENIIMNDGKITLKDLRDTVKVLSKCVDQKTVNYKVQNFLIENNIKVTEGCLYSF